MPAGSACPARLRRSSSFQCSKLLVTGTLFGRNQSRRNDTLTVHHLRNFINRNRGNPARAVAGRYVKKCVQNRGTQQRRIISKRITQFDRLTARIVFLHSLAIERIRNEGIALYLRQACMRESLGDQTSCSLGKRQACSSGSGRKNRRNIVVTIKTRNFLDEVSGSRQVGAP